MSRIIPNSILLALLFLTTWCQAAAPGPPTYLRCEFQVDPLGIDVRQPKLSWIVNDEDRGEVQTAYRVLVASSETLLAQGQGDLWDTGRVPSNQQTALLYAGEPLQSQTRYWWQVKTWDKDGNGNAWSKPAWFETGMLDPSDWKAQWIGGDFNRIRKSFCVDEPVKQARAYVSGQGYYEFRLNGDEVSDDVHVPGHTKVRSHAGSRPFGNHLRSLYRTYDITDALRPGENVCGMWLGDGFYNLQSSMEAREQDGQLNVFGIGSWRKLKGVRTRKTFRASAAQPLVIEVDRVSLSGQGEFASSILLFKDKSRCFHLWNQLGASGERPWNPGNRRKYESKGWRYALSPNDPNGTPLWDEAVGGNQPIKLVHDGSTIQIHIGGRELTEVPVKWSDNMRVQLGAYRMAPGDWVDVRFDSLRINGSVWDDFDDDLLDLKRWETVENIDGEHRERTVIAQIEIQYADGSTKTIVTDRTWQGSPDGAMLLNSVYHGEWYDARLEDGWDKPGYHVAGGWWPVEKTTAFRLVAQLEPIRVMERIRPVSVRKAKPGVYLYDFGKKVAGWCRIQGIAKAGTKVTLVHGEASKDGKGKELDYPGSNCNAKNTDVYIFKGDGVEQWEPKFTYHGLRFVELHGWPGEPPEDLLEACSTHDAFRTVGRFSCSDDLLNFAQNTDYVGIQKMDLHSVPTDCAQRGERLGWGGDALVVTEATMLNFDMTQFYAKWMDDFDSCTGEDGSVPDVIPDNGHPGDVTGHFAWRAPRVNILWDFYMYYGDPVILRKHYEPAKEFIGWLKSCDDGGHIIHEKHSPYGGDHGGGGAATIEGRKALATEYYYRCVDVMARIATVLGEDADAKVFRSLADRIARAHHETFFRPDKGYYCDGTWTNNSLPLHFGMVPQEHRQRVLDYLIKRTGEQKRTDGGILNRYSMFEVLIREDLPDLTHMLISNWLGQTALSTYRHPDRGGSHVMLRSGPPRWCFKALAGIRVTKPGFEEVLIQPQVPKAVDFAEASIETVRGKVSSSWRKSEGGINLEVTVPVNSTATVKIPYANGELASIRESGRVIVDQGRPITVPDVKYLSADARYITLELGSGAYRFDTE